MMNDPKDGLNDLVDDAELGALIRDAGPRRALPEIELAAIRARTCAAWENEVRTTRRAATRRWVSRLSIAAAIGGALLAVWLLRERAVAPARVEMASVELVTGVVSVRSEGGEPRQMVRGERLTAGSAIETGHDAGRAAIRIANGVAIRLDEATRATLVAAGVVRLDEGALYVDTGTSNPREGGGSPRGVEIRTIAGTVRDIGTQFEVRVLDSTRATLVRVREGAATVERDGFRREAGAGMELVVETSGAFSERAVRSWGLGWEWTLSASPRYEIEGRTLREFLGWVARETGWTVQFSDSALESRAGEIVLHRTIEGSRTDQAPYPVLAGSGLGGVVIAGVVRFRYAGPK